MAVDLARKLAAGDEPRDAGEGVEGEDERVAGEHLDEGEIAMAHQASLRRGAGGA